MSVSKGQYWIVGKNTCQKIKFLIFCVNVKISNALLTNKFKPRHVRGFTFVPTKAVLVRKRRRTFRAYKTSLPQWGKVAAEG
jgi:hypothetical protein